jgi:hypothetical protein
MLSDDEEFDDTVESHTPDRKTQDKVARFSLRQAPSGETSENIKNVLQTDEFVQSRQQFTI